MLGDRQLLGFLQRCEAVLDAEQVQRVAAVAVKCPDLAHEARFARQIE